MLNRRSDDTFQCLLKKRSQPSLGECAFARLLFAILKRQGAIQRVFLIRKLG